MPLCESLIDDNIGYLHQALSLLQRISDDLYRKPTPFAFDSSVGQHLRHCLDHYESFLAGWQAARIDYDTRERDTRVESDREYTLLRIAELVSGLRRVTEQEQESQVEVKQDGSAEHETAMPWSSSSVRRELQFLVSHTVHHFALIAVILRLHGFVPDADFGIAPSTLRHRQALKACAQ